MELGKITSKDIHKTCELKESVAQYIHLITTTYFGEYRIDQDFGCSIWEFDFDNSITNNQLKENFKKSLTLALNKYEKRLSNIDVSISILQVEFNDFLRNKRVKKKIELEVRATLTHTNERFRFFEYFYLGPLSYY